MYTHDMVTKLQKWGNSMGVRLGRDVVQSAALKEGMEVEVTAADGAITIRPKVGRKTYRLSELLKASKTKHARNPHGEWGGDKGGREVI